jgi:hypothetical protein
MVSAEERSFSKALKLRAGQLELEFEPANMLVRRIRLGSHELVRGIYAAVRDVNWGTYPLHLTELETVIERDRFEVRWLSTTPVVEWLGELRGTEHGEITYEIRGAALDSFETMRTGICVLHPSKECQGLTCLIEHPDGRKEQEWFPIEIAPHQPFFNIRAMEYAGPGDATVRIDFHGDVFETEDQRNWSDASYKTYCRPLDSPAPYALKAGALVEQSVRVSLVRGEPFSPTPLPECATIAVQPPGFEVLSFPKIGTMLSASALSSWQADRLKAMKLAHVGVSIDLADSSWLSSLAAAERLGIPAEVHLRSFDRADELQHLLCALKDVEIARILVISDDLGVNRESLVDEIQNALRAPIPVVAASKHNFTELNRSRPRTNRLTGVGFAMNPQVHAFDDLSLMETTEIHGDLVKNARRLSKGLPISVGPITLEPRHWVDRDPDPRLHSEFGAAWTFASLASLAMSAVESVTYFESHGPRGILCDRQDETTPIERLLDLILRFREFPILRTASDLPLAVRSLLFCGPSGPVAVVGNLRDTRVEVALFGDRIVLEPYECRSVESGGLS